MRCPDPGALRAALDDEAPATVRAHVDGCARCRAASDGLAADAATASGAVALLTAPAVPEVATSGVANPEVATTAPAARTTPTAREATVTTLPPPRPQRRVAVAAVAVVALLAGVLATPGGRSAAADFLASFRSERFEVVTVDPATGDDAFASLAALGEVAASGEPQPTPVADAEAAAEAIGAPVALPAADALPSSVTADEPTFAVTAPEELRVTFDADRIAAHLRAEGADTAVPDGLDGASLVVRIPAAVAIAYPGDGDAPGLVVGQARAVEADVEGDITLDAVRAFLLDLPGLPPETVRQLEGIEDWQTTLPVPLPADVAAMARDAEVAGAPGLVVDGLGGMGSAALWQRDGMVRGVAAPAPLDEVLGVADALR